MSEVVYGMPLGPRVSSVEPNENFELILFFNNGEKRKFDAKRLLSIKAFAPLKDITFFKSARVEYGTVVWPQDIDYCPDTLYEQSIPI